MQDDVSKLWSTTCQILGHGLVKLVGMPSSLENNDVFLFDIKILQLLGPCKISDWTAPDACSNSADRTRKLRLRQWRWTWRSSAQALSRELPWRRRAQAEPKEGRINAQPRTVEVLEEAAPSTSTRNSTDPSTRTGSSTSTRASASSNRTQRFVSSEPSGHYSSRCRLLQR